MTCPRCASSTPTWPRASMHDAPTGARAISRRSRTAAACRSARTASICSAVGCWSARRAAATSRRCKSAVESRHGVYVCATRRRKPGVCTNTLALPIAETDDAVLVDGRRRGARHALHRGTAGAGGPRRGRRHGARSTADRERLRGEVEQPDRAQSPSGVSADTVAPDIKRARSARSPRIDAQLRAPRQARPNIEKLREALDQRAAAVEGRPARRAEGRAAAAAPTGRAADAVGRQPSGGLRWDAPSDSRRRCWMGSSHHGWRPQRDSNPRYRRERPASWASGRWGRIR